jgi:hypothetical protein
MAKSVQSAPVLEAISAAIHCIVARSTDKGAQIARQLFNALKLACQGGCIAVIGEGRLRVKTAE